MFYLFDITNNDLTHLKIEKSDDEQTCYIKSENNQCYSGFILYRKRIIISCDVSFYKSSKTDKYIPRLIFKKLDKNGNEKLTNCEKPINIELNDSEKAESFWKMIGFIQKFKNLVDVGEFQEIYKISKTDNSLTDENILEYLKINPTLLNEIVENELTEKDVVSIGYRKKQLEIFKTMLEDKNVKEADWQKFFEKNSWIFGYGLSYVFSTNLDDKKLEQVVSGFDFNNFGKRVDGLLKTAGLINSLCFVEIKTHKTSLLKNEYRAGCWNVSDEFSGAVTQIQNTVCFANKKIQDSVKIKNDQGYFSGEEIFNFNPKAYLIIGKLDEFTKNQEVHHDKYRSFELFRKNVNSPEIITFDELYERAKFIVDSRVIN
jgi:hypothetical protein